MFCGRVCVCVSVCVCVCVSVCQICWHALLHILTHTVYETHTSSSHGSAYTRTTPYITCHTDHSAPTHKSVYDTQTTACLRTHHSMTHGWLYTHTYSTAWHTDHSTPTNKSFHIDTITYLPMSKSVSIYTGMYTCVYMHVYTHIRKHHQTLAHAHPCTDHETYLCVYCLYLKVCTSNVYVSIRSV